MKKNITIIGSGFASISAACYLAKEGYNVHVYEKNSQLGGRARQFEKDGFKFDMGPTWYWMPDVFERFFADFGKKPSDYYHLERLGPAYRVYFGERDFIDISDDLEEIKSAFDKEEPDASVALTEFLKKAESNYEVAIKDLVYKPGLSPFELVNKSTMFEIPQFIGTIHDVAKRKFKSPKLRQIIEFPVLFLGAKPSMTPAFYSFMNFADLSLGTWYPKGGMKSVVDGLITLAEELGVNFITDANVNEIITGKYNEVKKIKVNGEDLTVELLVSGADYVHTESLLPEKFRRYSKSYWQKRVMAPSSLLFYVGLDRKVKNVLHHTLFFDVPFDEHAKAIYDEPKWPREPLFYASFPSMTDDTIAPNGKEAAIFLIPLAPDLEDTEELREQYFDIVMTRLEKLTEQDIRSSILFKESYCVEDFKNDYNSFKGNAYGMANTLLQTAFLRPKLKSKKLKNLYFTGQLTVPGPGVPPSLISGKLVSDLLIKDQ
ncbi:phytoene desaturase family protein [Lutimonas zeaxanthinifaciens]|uniref:phytoene desaturase family protein n=1 Tax=Lutimonas zeaxanthinifaciens TaxID=3060215 RepID=UPI00265D4789|nr:phytoene desaturase family protein [Lutimonas sp. YSD2104]WKK65193.1 phytoene desaturase family protein [Lutimonas sp. YSD2104]